MEGDMTLTKMDTQRDNSLSYMRVFAALAIVILHVFQYVIEGFNIMGTDKIASISIRNSTLWAVPIFVLVSGALLLDDSREITYGRLFRRYILRIAVVLVCTLFIYELVDAIIYKDTIDMHFFLKGLKNLFFGTGWKPLWYLYMLLAIYLMLPIYRLAAKSMSAKDSRYLIIVLFIFQSVFSCVEKFTSRKSGFYICVYTVYTLYFFAGHAIYKGHIRFKTIPAAILLIISSVANVILTIMSFKLGLKGVYGAMNNYASSIVVVQSLCLFSLLLKHRSEKTGILGRALLAVDKVTLGIYLVHLIILRVVIYSMKWNPFKYGIYMTFLLAFGIFVVSFIIARVLHMIPLVKRFI